MTNNRDYLDRLYGEYFRAKEHTKFRKQAQDNPSDREVQIQLQLESDASQHEIIISNLLTDFLNLKGFQSF